jgi:hypothetical protein
VVFRERENLTRDFVWEIEDDSDAFCEQWREEEVNEKLTG